MFRFWFSKPKPAQRDYRLPRGTVLSPEAQQRFERVRDVLNNEWNPIGVPMPECADEYEDYAAYIAAQPKWSEAALADYLHYIAHEIIGFDEGTQHREVALHTAQRLLAVF